MGANNTIFCKEYTLINSWLAEDQINELMSCKYKSCLQHLKKTRDWVVDSPEESWRGASRDLARGPRAHTLCVHTQAAFPL